MKKLLFLLLALVLASGSTTLISKVVLATPPSTGSLDLQVAASADDTEVYNSGVAWTWNQGDLYVSSGYYIATVQKSGGGLRFTGVNIPQGATITSAYLTLYCNYYDGGATVYSYLFGEKEKDAASFTSLADYQARCGTDVGGKDNTKRTTAQVSWDSIPSWSFGSTYTSPDISSVVQEIVNQSGWVSGNHLVIFWTDHAGRSTASNNCERTAATYEYLNGSYSAHLHVEYTANSPSTDAALSSLTVSSGTLTPTFATGATTYTDSVANSVTSITVTPAAHQGQATIKVNGTPVASGQVSGAISLNVGVNTISVVVTAQDGITTDTYTMTVTRAASNNANFGYNGAGTYSSSGFYTNNFLFCEPGYTGVTSTGVSMSFLTSNSDTINAHNVRCAIYTLSAGTFSLIAQTNAISVPAGAAKGWVTGNFTTSPNLSSSTTYYLAVQADSSSLKFYIDSQPGWKQYVYGSKSGTWPSTFVSPTLNWNVEMPILVNCIK